MDTSRKRDQGSHFDEQMTGAATLASRIHASLERSLPDNQDLAAVACLLVAATFAADADMDPDLFGALLCHVYNARREYTAAQRVASRKGVN